MSGYLPLYKIDEPPTYRKDMNTGLWYDKFCNEWKRDWSGLGEEGKKNWINTVTKGQIGYAAKLSEVIERRKKLLDSCEGQALNFKTTGPFVTGLGREHPVENGFAWHHTLGTPYLPGSSVKGMVRNWVEQWEDADPEIIKRIFGPRSRKDGDASVGSVIFMDALPVSPVQLKADVMTPHYGPYYSEGKDPGDWHNPIPIPFLVVDEGQEFLFGIIPRNPRIDDCKIVKKWLLDALGSIGAGAKTAVGYGRFEHVKITSPAQKWLNNLAIEHNKNPGEIITNPPKVLKERLIELDDDDLKEAISLELKDQLIHSNLWEGNQWGQLKKLVSFLKQYLDG